MKRLLIFILACGLKAHGVALPCSAPCTYGPQQVTHGGITRYYAAYFPATVAASKPYPLIVVLNGANILPYNKPKLNAQSVLQSFADANKVAILWVWSAVYDTGPTPGAASQPYANCTTASDACQWVWALPFDFTRYYTNYDDFGYITDRIANAETAWGADSNRILLMGGSTGGLEAHAYAQANPGNVLAIGTFAGPVWAAQNGGATPNAPTGDVNVFMAHGDADPTLPYCGGKTSDPWYGLSNISTASADQTFDYWTGAEGMNCSTITPAANLCPSSGGVVQKVATGCRNGKRAMFVDYPGADHLNVANYSPELLAAFWNFVFPNGAPTTTTLLSSVNPSAVGQSISLTATVSSASGTPTGTVAFVRNGTTFATSPLSGGQATLNWTFGSTGTKSIIAIYSGDANFATSLSTSTLSQAVNPAPTTTALASSLNPANVGQPVALTATVANQYGVMPTGTVTFVRNGASFGTAPLGSGQATLNWSFGSTGMKSITAVYSGDPNSATSISSAVSQVVSYATTTTLISSLNPSSVGQSVVLTATVASQNGGTLTGTVTFMENGAPLGTADLSAGQATLNSSFSSAGTKAITAVYSGDATFMTSTSTTLNQSVGPAATTTTLVSSLNPSSVGQPVALSATVATQYGGTPTGTVTFVANGSTVGTAQLSGGQATINSAFVSVGMNSIIAVYSGDPNFTTSTSTTALSQVVSPATTTVTGVSSLNPSSVGQPVVLTATISPQYGGIPTGTVTWVKNGIVFGTSALSGGQATLNWTFGSTAMKSIIAIYSGDVNFVASNSPTLSQAVNRANTTTVLLSSLNPSTAGQSVTLTAIVTPQFGGTPTGTVRFMNGTTMIGTAALSGGQATFNKVFPTDGTKPLTAIYAGDLNFATSTGALNQTVN